MAWAIVAAATITTVGGSLLSRSSQKAANRANNTAADATALQAQIAAEQWDRYLEVFDPIERQFVQDAQDYASPERFAKAAGDASATVASQYGKARDRLSRTPGLDPSSGAYQASMVGLDLSQAAADATQQNAARNRVDDLSYARMQDAVALGKGLPSSAASQLASSASGSMALARYNQGQADNTAASFGRITDRVMNSPSMSGWLGMAPSSGVKSEVSTLGSNTWNPFSDYNTGANGWGSYGE